MKHGLAWAVVLLCASGVAAGAQAGAAASDEVDCIVEPFLQSRLSPSVEGVVQAVLVDRGDRVVKGQVLAELETDVEAANLALASARAKNDAPVISAQTRYEYLKRKRDRLQQIRGVVAEASVDEAISDARVGEHQAKDLEYGKFLAELEAERAARLLEQRRVRSPIAGIVTERNLAPGEYRHVQAHVLTVAQLDPLKVEAFLPIRFFGRVKLGDKLTVRPEAPISGSYEATVTVVDRVFDAGSGTFGLRLELPNADYALPAGLKCRLQVPDRSAGGKFGTGG